MKRAAALVFVLALGFSPAVRADRDAGFWFVQMADTQLGFSSGNKDPAPEIANFHKAVEWINQVKPAFVVISGDLINHPRDATQIAAFWQVARDPAGRPAPPRRR